jgi:hypothetical protein
MENLNRIADETDVVGVDDYVDVFLRRKPQPKPVRRVSTTRRPVPFEIENTISYHPEGPPRPNNHDRG